jgi:hypothetical protein
MGWKNRAGYKGLGKQAVKTGLGKQGWENRLET